MIRFLNLCFDEEYYKCYSEKDFIAEIKGNFGSTEAENEALAKEAYALIKPTPPPAKGSRRTLNVEEGAE